MAIDRVGPRWRPAIPPRSVPAPAPPERAAAATGFSELDGLILQHNTRLAAAGIALRLERRGRRLGLRGPLPARPQGDGVAVQRLSLGLPASAEGLAAALERLREVQRQLELGSFRWESWSRRPRPAPESAAVSAAASAAMGAAGGAALTAVHASALEALLQSFEQAFLADPRRRRNPAGSRTTWTAAYRPYLRRLQQIADSHGLDKGAPLWIQTLESYSAGSRSRQQCGTALAALARHGGLALPPDWSDRAAGYGLHLARYRRLPSDADILSLVEQVPNPAWRLVYGLIATYGLRNHEAFFCDLSALASGGDRVIRVLPTSKTGEHQVWPFQPHWVEHFGLSPLGHDRAALPRVCTDLRRTTLQQVGRRVAEQFRRYGLPITPYDLRHAWAVRTIHIGLPDTVAARMMGHSVAIHTRTYHHWITRRDQQQAVDAALARHTAARSA